MKNLPFATRLERVKGLPNPAECQRATDVFLKTQWLLERGGGIVFSTGDSHDCVDLPDILRGFDPTACGLEDGLVFLFEDDRRPNPDFLRWVSGMAGRGKRSLESRRGYPYDVAGWIDFLHDAYEADYLHAEFEDLEEYGGTERMPRRSRCRRRSRLTGCATRSACT